MGTYVEIPLEDIAKFVTRAYRALQPTKGMEADSEIFYMLHLSENVGVKVLTSVKSRGLSGVGVGEDAIRVQLFDTNKNKPLKSGKAPRIYRTQGWRDNLQDRIDDEVEDYHNREEYWEQRAS